MVHKAAIPPPTATSGAVALPCPDVQSNFACARKRTSVKAPQGGERDVYSSDRRPVDTGPSIQRTFQPTNALSLPSAKSSQEARGCCEACPAPEGVTQATAFREALASVLTRVLQVACSPLYKCTSKAGGRESKLTVGQPFTPGGREDLATKQDIEAALFAE